MTDRPILFSAPMIRALLDGRKTQTRRLLKPQPGPECGGFQKVFAAPPYFEALGHDGRPCHPFRDGPGLMTPYPPIAHAIGDRLWVRETWAASPAFDGGSLVWVPDDDCLFYRADRVPACVRPGHIGDNTPGQWRPSIHMPRWASRLTLVVTDVRVERLQEISEADAIAEGATSRPNCHGFQDMYPGWSMDWSKVGGHSDYAAVGPGPLRESDISLPDARMAFANYWDEINGPGAWDANPWVVALTFTVHRCNIDQMEVGQ